MAFCSGSTNLSQLQVCFIPGMYTYGYLFMEGVLINVLALNYLNDNNNANSLTITDTSGLLLKYQLRLVKTTVTP